MRLLFLKLGGSAITDKTQEATPRPDVIREAARAVHSALEHDTALRLVLGHGSGSFGHFAATKWGFGQKDNWRAFAETGAAAARLNRLVTDIFLEQDVPVVSLQPSASARSRDGELQSCAVKPIETALHHKLVPLIYGDVCFDETRGMSIVSTDALFSYLAPILNPSRIIYATIVSGIFTADPLTHPDAELIREITPKTFANLKTLVGTSHGVDVTGGMLDKVQRALSLLEGIPTLEIFVVKLSQDLIVDGLGKETFNEGTRMTNQ